MQKMWASVVLTCLEYDHYPQFYGGLLAGSSNGNGYADTFFIDSLIAGSTGNETSARRELIKSLALNGRPFAALRLAASDTSQKDDDLQGILSAAAEQSGEYAKAIEFEKLRRGGRTADRIAEREPLSAEAKRRTTHLVVLAQTQSVL